MERPAGITAELSTGYRFAARSLIALLIVTSSCGGGTEGTTTDARGPQSTQELLPSAESVRARATLVADCLVRGGLEVTIMADGSLQFDPSGMSDEEVAQINAECAKLVEPVGAPVALSDEDLGLLYDDALEQVGCLAAEGYEIAWTTTLETFREQWRAGNPYLPYGALGEQFPSLSQDELVRLGGVCPQFQS